MEWETRRWGEKEIPLTADEIFLHHYKFAVLNSQFTIRIINFPKNN